MGNSNEIVRELLATALAMPKSDIGPKTSLSETKEWDSLAHMRIILAIEEQLGRCLSPDEILETKDFGTVDRLIE